MIKIIADDEIKKPINALEQKDEVPNDVYIQLFIGHHIYQKFKDLTE